MPPSDSCICVTDEYDEPALGLGLFFWRPQWFYSWPIKVMRGHDEFHRSTVGVVTWAGSIFLAWPCRDWRRLSA